MKKYIIEFRLGNTEWNQRFISADYYDRQGTVTTFFKDNRPIFSVSDAQLRSIDCLDESKFYALTEKEMIDIQRSNNDLHSALTIEKSNAKDFEQRLNEVKDVNLILQNKLVIKSDDCLILEKELKKLKQEPEYIRKPYTKDTMIKNPKYKKK